VITLIKCLNNTIVSGIILQSEILDI